jgi:AcrR family transcriptional regulator
MRLYVSWYDWSTMGPLDRGAVIAATRKVLSRHRDSTMEEIAASAGVSLRTLYRWFSSRQELLAAVDHEAPPSPRQLILEAALETLGRGGLAELSMDRLAVLAGVSRATLYRAFPGKPALFRALIETYSPWEPIADVLETAQDGPPNEVMPRIAETLARALEGRTGVLLRMVFEMIKGEPDAVDGVRRSLSRGLPDLIQYLGGQMATGGLRRMHPIIAFQLLAGPIFVHIATRPLAAMMGFKVPMEDVVRQIVDAWLRAMVPKA